MDRDDQDEPVGKPGPKPGSGERVEGARRVPADIDPATYARVEKLLTRGWTPLVEGLLKDWLAASSGKLKIVEIPIRGWTAGGPGVPADDVIEGTLSVPSTITSEDTFAVSVRGDSMAPTIRDEEYAIVDSNAVVKNGKIVLAIINDDDESVGTIKRFFKRGKRMAELRPDNPDAPVIIKELAHITISGVVVGAANEPIGSTHPVVRRIE